MRRKLVAGNWKMNTDLAAAKSLASAIAAGTPGGRQSDVLIAPPFPYLVPVAEAIKGSAVELGAQNVSAKPNGALTGEISLTMLADLGVKRVILGHSERRQFFGETDAVVNAKVLAAVATSISPILCIGETLEQFDKGETPAVIASQLAGSLAGVTVEQMAKVVIAYEPVWAIGTGRSATKEQAQAVHRQIRNWLSEKYSAQVAGATRILYGGSVKPAVAGELLSQPDIDGALVGGASLIPADFLAIMAAAEAVTTGS